MEKGEMQISSEKMPRWPQFTSLSNFSSSRRRDLQIRREGGVFCPRCSLLECTSTMTSWLNGGKSQEKRGEGILSGSRPVEENIPEFHLDDLSPRFLALASLSSEETRRWGRQPAAS